LIPNLKKATKSAVFGVVDIKTTGLHLARSYRSVERWNRIVEIGAVLADSNGNIQDTWQSLVDPKRPIPGSAVEIHGITDAEVRGAPDVRTASEEMCRFLEKADIVFAFNSSFDLRFLVHEWDIVGVKPPSIVLYDVARLASRAGFGRQGLAGLAKNFYIRADAAHRALEVAETVAKVLARLLSKLSRARTLKQLAEIHDATAPVYSTSQAMESVSKRSTSSRRKVSEPGISVERLERELEFHDYQYFVLNDPLISDEDYDLLRRQLEALHPDSPVLQRIGSGNYETETFRNKVQHAIPMLSLDKCYDEAGFRSWARNIVVEELRTVLKDGRDDDLKRGYGHFYDTDLEDRRDELSKSLQKAKQSLKSKKPQTPREQLERMVNDLPTAIQALDESREQAIRDGIENLDVAVSPKIDGVAASLRYDEKGVLQIAATRGDGTVGEDFTINARLIQGIPQTVVASDIEVRGEVYMARSVFQEKYSKSFPNTRNLTAGSLKQKESNRSQLLDLVFFAYDLRGEDVDSEESKFERLRALGFEHVGFLLATIGSVQSIYEKWVSEQAGWDFDADGVVIRLNDTRLHSLLKSTAHHPRSAIAYKFQGDTGFSSLLDVEWGVSRTGMISPVGVVAPIILSGAKVQRASLHNVHHVKGIISQDKEKTEYSTPELKADRESSGRAGFYLGDKVRVTRRGGVIPKIEETHGEGREPASLPERCPSCGEPTVFSAPVAFVAGARVDLFTDDIQMDAILETQTAIARAIQSNPTYRKDDLIDLICAVAKYSPARKTVGSGLFGEHVLKSDDAYQHELTWGRTWTGRRLVKETEKRARVHELIRKLPSESVDEPELMVILVHDPGLGESWRFLERVSERRERWRLDIRLIITHRSRCENEPKADVWLMDQLAWRLSDTVFCTNPSACRDVIVGQIEHFAKAAGIDGFGKKWIENLFDRGLLRRRSDLFRLGGEQLTTLDRMGDVLATKLVNNIQAATKMSLATFLVSLGVEQLGPHVAGILEQKCGTLEAALGLTEQELATLHESVRFGIAHQVFHGLRRLRPVIDELLEFVTVRAPAPAAEPGGAFAGKSFVFTGKMATMDRKAAQIRVKALGGEARSQVVTDLDYLVVGDDGSPLFGQGSKGSKLLKAERINASGGTIEIIPEARFLEMMERAEAELLP